MINKPIYLHIITFLLIVPCSQPITDYSLSTPSWPKWSPVALSFRSGISLPKQVHLKVTLVIDKKSQVDWGRNRNLFIVGSLYFAPMLHMWYCKALPYIQSKVFSEATPKATKVFASMAADQLAFAPIILAGFFITNSLF